MKLFKLAAEKHGFALWYDRSLALWALTKDDKETQYFSAYVLKQMGIAKFISVYLN